MIKFDILIKHDSTHRKFLNKKDYYVQEINNSNDRSIHSA